MANKDTKNILIDAFKQLIEEKDFHKITIKDITDRAGVVRPTFYYYFQDKYNIFEVILDDLNETLTPIIYQGMVEEYLKLTFMHFEMDRSFYNKAFKITGQNSFEDILFEKLLGLIMDLLDSGYLSFEKTLGQHTGKYIAEYSTLSLIYIIKIWMTEEDLKDVTSTEINQAYEKFVSLSISDYFHNNT